MKTEITVEQAKEVLKNAGYIMDGLWQDGDIHWIAENNFNITLTNQQLQDVKCLIARSFDASIGVNWDVINATIDIVLNDGEGD